MKWTHFFAAALLLSFVLTGCSKEARIGKKLAGTWDATSFTEDGVELIGSLLTSFEMYFGEYNKKDGKGDYKFTAVLLGSSIIETGTYSLDSAGEEVTFTTDAGETTTYMLTLDGDNLELEGTVDGLKYIIQAKRK